MLNWILILDWTRTCVYVFSFFFDRILYGFIKWCIFKSLRSRDIASSSSLETLVWLLFVALRKTRSSSVALVFLNRMQIMNAWLPSFPIFSIFNLLWTEQFRCCRNSRKQINGTSSRLIKLQYLIVINGWLRHRTWINSRELRNLNLFFFTSSF
jgi:hypothetical protein